MYVCARTSRDVLYCRAAVPKVSKYSCSKVLLGIGATCCCAHYHGRHYCCYDLLLPLPLLGPSCVHD